MTFGSEYDIVL